LSVPPSVQAIRSTKPNAAVFVREDGHDPGTGTR
jgi:hypothetical protein